MDVGSMYSWWISVWPDVKDFLYSAFFTSIVGAGFASYAGAAAAQRIAERNKVREQLTKEVRETRAAAMVSFGLSNSFIQVKKQHVRQLKADFEAEKNKLAQFEARRKAGALNPGEILEIRFDMETLSLPPLPIDILQRQIFERLSLVGRPLAITTVLAQTIHTLNDLFKKRDALIEEYKSGRRTLTIPLYFGLPVDGSVNNDIPSFIDGICSMTDDGIFFSRLLGKDLVAHGNRLVADFEQSFGAGPAKLQESTFEDAERLGLMPDEAHYQDWFTKFKIATPQPKKGCLESLKERIKTKRR